MVRPTKNVTLKNTMRNLFADIKSYCKRFTLTPEFFVTVIPVAVAFSGLARSLLDLSMGIAGVLGCLIAGFSVPWLLQNAQISLRWREAWLWGAIPVVVLYHWPTHGLPAWHTADAANHFSNMRTFFDPALEFGSFRDRLLSAPAFYVYWKFWVWIFGDIVGLQVTLYSTIFLSAIALRILMVRYSQWSKPWFAAGLFLVTMPVFHYLMTEGYFRHFWSLLVYAVSLNVMQNARRPWWLGACIMSLVMLGSYGLYVGDLWMIFVLSGLALNSYLQGLRAVVLLMPTLAITFFLYRFIVFNPTVGLIYEPLNCCAFFALALLAQRKYPSDESSLILDRLVLITLCSSMGLILWAGGDSHYALKYPLVPFAIIGPLTLGSLARISYMWKVPLLACIAGFWISFGPVYLDRVLQRKYDTPLLALVESESTEKLDRWLDRGGLCDQDGQQTWNQTPWPRRAFWYALRMGTEASPVCYPGMIQTKKRAAQ